MCACALWKEVEERECIKTHTHREREGGREGEGNEERGGGGRREGNGMLRASTDSPRRSPTFITQGSAPCVLCITPSTVLFTESTRSCAGDRGAVSIGRASAANAPHDKMMPVLTSPTILICLFCSFPLQEGRIGAVGFRGSGRIPLPSLDSSPEKKWRARKVCRAACYGRISWTRRRVTRAPYMRSSSSSEDAHRPKPRADETS